MLRITLGLGLVVICSFGTYLSGMFAYANTYLQTASQAIDVGPREPLPSLTQIAFAQDYTAKALSLTPHDPDSLDLAGRTRYLEAISLPPEAERATLLQEAKEFHLKALYTRSFWPYSHMNMLFAKSLLEEFDAEYAWHFQRAYQLGFDDRSVNRDLTYLGIRDWSQVDSSVRALVVSITARAMDQRIVTSNSVRPYFESQDQLIEFCSLFEPHQVEAALCDI